MHIYIKNVQTWDSEAEEGEDCIRIHCEPLLCPPMICRVFIITHNDNDTVTSSFLQGKYRGGKYYRARGRGQLADHRLLYYPYTATRCQSWLSPQWYIEFFTIAKHFLPEYDYMYIQYMFQ